MLQVSAKKQRAAFTLDAQFELPTPKIKACRGRMFSVADYTVDVTELGFADVVGGENERKAG